MDGISTQNISDCQTVFKELRFQESIYEEVLYQLLR